MSKRGFTFLEVIVAFTIFSVALLGYFENFNTALQSSYRATQESTAVNLCRGLLAEIVSKNFVDPQTPNNDLGSAPDGEVGRNAFDDVDDYKGYSETPPLTIGIGGQAMDGTNGTPNCIGFTRSVDVAFCNIAGGNIVTLPGVTVGTSPYKLITVTVSGPSVRNIVISEIVAQ